MTFSYILAYGQCIAVGGASGTVQNSTSTATISFTVATSPAASITNLGLFTGVCGITFPSIVTPWSGNTLPSNVTYTFSIPITSIDVLVGYTGLNGSITPESFIFTTNGSSPTIAVNSGTCVPWIIAGNQTTSPSIVGGLNGVHTVTSATPFTTLTINAPNNSGNGGSSFTLCDQSIVNCGPPQIDLGNDTTLCPGETLTLDASSATATYLWQDNSTNSTFNVTQQGTYWVTATNSCGTATDTILINYAQSAPTVDLGNDTTLCQGGTLLLDATQANATYLWQDNSTNAIFNVSQQGTYSVTVDINGCSASDSINVNFNPAAFFNLGNDTTLCPGQNLTLDATFANATYLWQDNSTNATFNVNQTGSYWTTVTLNNCTVTDSILVNYDPQPMVNLGIDTTLCTGQTFLLDATMPNTAYLWQDNSTNATFNVSQQGTYSVVLSSPAGCTATDTINVNFVPPLTLNLGPDLVLCPGQTVNLDATNANANYLWQDASVAPVFTVSLPGQYSVTVNNQCETISDTINVNYVALPVDYLGNDTTVCGSTGLLLSVNIPGAQTQWQDQSISNNFMVTEAGVYTATTTLQGCVTTDQIDVQFIPVPEVDLGFDIVSCSGNQLLLQNSTAQAGSYLWSTGSSNEQIIVDSIGTYSLQITNLCGTDSDTVVIDDAGCNCQVYIPNTFSPDDNEFNQLFGAKHDCPFTEFNLRIFNRWGELVFESFDPNGRWDGTYKNRKAQDGVYIYYVTYSTDFIIDEVLIGHVQVIR